VEAGADTVATAKRFEVERLVLKALA
jgi:hypothetical protein